LIVFPFAPEAAKQAARIQAEMQAQGSRLPILDLLIGCTAVHHGQTLVTRDADFHRIKGLDVLVV
jgi:predicted nucleic acid-binding protein